MGRWDPWLVSWQVEVIPVGGIGWPGLLYLVFPQGSLFLAGGSGKAVGSLLSFGSLTRSPHLSGRWGCGLSFITSLGLVSVSKITRYRSAFR